MRNLFFFDSIYTAEEITWSAEENLGYYKQPDIVSRTNARKRMLGCSVNKSDLLSIMGFR